MNLNQLLYFSVTARHQHFTRAAEELFISQPSLSYAISSLEEELGVALFQKKGRNVVLTPHGKLFLTHVERALSEIQQGREALSRMITETEIRIVIASATTSIGSDSLPHLIRTFLADPQNSDVHFDFHQVGEPDLSSGVRSMKYDIAICNDSCSDNDVTSIPLFTCPIVAIVAPEHPLANRQSISLSELERKQYPLLLRSNMPSSQQILRMMDKPAISCSVQDRMALLTLAAENFGVGITILTQDISNFPLCVIPISTPGCSCTIHMAYKTSRYLTPALERFIAFMQNRAQAQ